MWKNLRIPITVNEYRIILCLHFNHDNQTIRLEACWTSKDVRHSSKCFVTEKNLFEKRLGVSENLFKKQEHVTYKNFLEIYHNRLDEPMIWR